MRVCIMDGRMYSFVLCIRCNLAHITHVPVRSMRSVIVLTTDNTQHKCERIGVHRSPSGQLVHNGE